MDTQPTRFSSFSWASGAWLHRTASHHSTAQRTKGQGATRGTSVVATTHTTRTQRWSSVNPHSVERGTLLVYWPLCSSPIGLLPDGETWHQQTTSVSTRPPFVTTHPDGARALPASSGSAHGQHTVSTRTSSISSGSSWVAKNDPRRGVAALEAAGGHRHRPPQNGDGNGDGNVGRARRVSLLFFLSSSCFVLFWVSSVFWSLDWRTPAGHACPPARCPPARCTGRYRR